MEKLWVLFQAVLKALGLAVMHCRGCHKAVSCASKENALTDKQKKEPLEILLPQPVAISENTYYTKPEKEWAQQQDHI